MTTSNNPRVDDAENALEWWLVSNAEAGVPELALVAVLRRYANTIEHLGYVPRTWDIANRPTDPQRDPRDR